MEPETGMETAHRMGATTMHLPLAETVRSGKSSSGTGPSGPVQRMRSMRELWDRKVPREAMGMMAVTA